MADESTIFDRILRREIPAKLVHEDEHVFAFHDVNPQAPVHVLVIPKKKAPHLAALADWAPAEVGALFRGVALVAKKLGLEEGGYRIVCNTGADGGQTVSYVHVHILGGRAMEWPPG